jgi:sugar lactone lactonase YvrE
VSKNINSFVVEKEVYSNSEIVTKIIISRYALSITTDLCFIVALISIPNIGANAKWIQNATTVAGGNGAGNGLNQFTSARGLYIDDDQTIYVADHANHRVVEWESGAISGQVVAGGNGPGNQANQLSTPTAVIVDKETDSLIICDFGNKRVVRWPRRNGTSGETIIYGIASYGLTMDSYGYLYVSDYYKHEVKRWKIGAINGTVVAGGNGQGNRLDQLNNPVNVFVDQDHSVYVSDGSNHRVMKWMEGAKEGIVVAGGQGAGNGLTQLNNPRGMIVDQLGTVYVADFSNHRVMCWPKGAAQGSVALGGNGVGAQPNQFNSCWDLSFDRQGNLYVSDCGNRRIQKFNIDSNSIQ